MVVEAEEEYEEQGGIEEDLMEVKTKIQENGRLDMMTHFKEGTKVVVHIAKAPEEQEEG